MKRVRCPKCDHYITFDETQYEDGQSLVFECEMCHKQFGIRIGLSKLKSVRKEEVIDEQENADACGSIVVVENVFHYKQVLPLTMGDNVIGRYAADDIYDPATGEVLWNLDENRVWKGLKVDKNRQGVTGKVCLAFDGEHMRFEENPHGFEVVAQREETRKKPEWR